MMNIDNIGLIENMAYYICPHCGEKLNIFGEGNGEAFAEEMESFEQIMIEAALKSVAFDFVAEVKKFQHR